MSEIGAITQGMQSVQGTGMYTASLDAFTKNAKAFEAYDFNKGFESEAAKKQKDAATFAEVALGFKTVPNSNNLYNRHHALLSKKYDLLFDDANISAMAATPEGRAAFDRAVQQLQQETKAYENIYAATFGDPSTADGTGMTYLDYEVRLKKGGGSSTFFQDQGYQIDRTDKDFNDQLIALDNSADILSKTITFDPSTGTWGGYDVDDKLLSIDMQDARNYFAYTASRAVFNEPSSAVSTAGVYDAMSKFSSDEAMLADAQTRASVSTLDAVAYWQKNKASDEDKEKTVQQLYAEMTNKKTLNVAIDAYAEAMVDEVNARKKREEAEKKRAQQGNRSNNTTPPPEQPPSLSIITDPKNGDKLVELDGLRGMEHKSKYLPVRSVTRKKNGEYQLTLDDDGRTVKVDFSKNDMTYKKLQERFKIKYGEGFFDKMISAMEGDTPKTEYNFVEDMLNFTSANNPWGN
jgi:hypothetical protein